MEHLIGSDWKDYFDVLIVQARKPRFFTDISRPIRVFDEHSGNHIWDRVTKLEKGVIYYEVNFMISSFFKFYFYQFFRALLSNCRN